MRAPTWLPMPARRTLRLVRRFWRNVRRQALHVSAPARQQWRRSLQLRVVTLTLVTSSLLVAGFGSLVAWRSANILLDRANDDVAAQLANKVDYAIGQLTVRMGYYDTKLPATMNETVRDLAKGNAAEDADGPIVSLQAEAADSLRPVTLPQPRENAPELITPEMVELVADEGKPAQQIRTADFGFGRKKYLVYGSPVPASFGQMELYLLVPLTTEDQAANEIRTTVLVTGIALVLLLGVVAALVTRLVVTPVRVAARTAQRLSAGLLDQRMKVQGEDDLALLASSFNQMAGNLQRQIVRLEDMSRLQRRFTSDVSHELRTPLTTVRMAADLIFAEREDFDPAVARSAELLQAELDRFESLLTDLLEISRFDAGFAALDAEPTDLVPVVHRVADRLAGLAEHAGVTIVLHVPTTPVIAEVDPRRVERILRNLVGNAIEHGEGRPMDVTLACDDAAVAVTVRDHGVGLKIGEEHLVFNRFWRADPSRARQTGGTGLGLSISLEDARLHGGWLEAWGAPGDGAQFRLTLPVRSGDRLTSAPLPLIPADRSTGAPVGDAPVGDAQNADVQNANVQNADAPDADERAADAAVLGAPAAPPAAGGGSAGLPSDGGVSGSRGADPVSGAAEALR